jgi:O-antigen/teichoic acid export membrane protein
MTGPQTDSAKTVREALSRNVTITIVARVIYMVTRFFVPPFILARVSMEAYGLWATAFILVSYVGISTMGLSAVYSKYVAEFSARGEYKRANQLLSTGLFIAVPLCAALFALIYLLWPWLVQYLHVSPRLALEARGVVLIVIGSFLLSLCTSAFSDALTGVQMESSNQFIWIVAYLFETALIFGLVGFGRGIEGLAEAFLLRTLLEEGLSTVVAFRRISWLRISPRLVNRDSVHLICSFGGVVQLTSLFAIGLNSIERALAAPLAGLSASGLLDVSKKLPGMAASIPNAFTSSLTPAASYLQGSLIEDSPEAQAPIRKLFLKGARYMNLSSAYFCAFIATASAPILTVWLGKHYDNAAILASLFAISTQMHLLTGPGTSLLKGLGRPKEEFYYCIPNVIALALFVPLSYPVFGGWTAVGIACAVVLSTFVSAAIFIRHANRILALPGAHYWKRVVWPGIVPYLVALPFALVLVSTVSLTARWTGAGIVSLAGIAYTALLTVVVDRWVFDEGERLWFRAILHPRFRRAARRAQEVAT